MVRKLQRGLQVVTGLLKVSKNDINALKKGFFHLFLLQKIQNFEILYYICFCGGDIPHTKTLKIMSKFRASIDSMEGFRVDTITAANGEQIDFIFFHHASFAISTPHHIIYVDPVSEYAPYETLPKADLILITHSHYDHLDVEAIDAVKSVDMPIICDKTSANILEREVLMMSHGSEVKPIDGVKIEGVAAYNTTPGHLQFHPKEREDCGYILTLCGTRIYIAGDTENTPEVKSVTGVDIAFLPVNQPYTMTVDQAIDAVKAIRPQIFYPYHYGGGDSVTDIDALVEGLKGVCEVRVRDME